MLDCRLLAVDRQVDLSSLQNCQECLQAQVDTLQWLESVVKLSSSSLNKLEASLTALRFSQPQPSVPVGEANIKALKEVLFMTDAQVRFAPHGCGRCEVASWYPWHGECTLEPELFVKRFSRAHFSEAVQHRHGYCRRRTALSPAGDMRDTGAHHRQPCVFGCKVGSVSTRASGVSCTLVRACRCDEAAWLQCACAWLDCYAQLAPSASLAAGASSTHRHAAGRIRLLRR